MRIKRHMLFLLGVTVFFIHYDGFAEDVNSEIKRIRSLEKAGQLQEAMKQYDALFRRNADNRLVFIYYKDFLLRTQQYSSALRLVRQASPFLQPVYEGALAEAQVLYRMGEHDLAVAKWDSLFQMYGDRKDYIQTAASQMIGERQVDRALALYEKGAERTGDAVQFAWSIASLSMNLHQYEKAVRAMLLHITEYPDHIRLVKSQIKQIPATDAVFRRVLPLLAEAVEKNPQKPEFADMLFEFYIQNGKYDQAYAWVEKLESRQKSKEKGALYFKLGQIALSEKAYACAEKAFRALLEIRNSDYKQETAHHFLARVYVEQNQWKPAASQYHLLCSGFSRSGHWPTYAYEYALVLQQTDASQDTVLAYLEKAYKHPKVSTETKLGIEDAMIETNMRLGHWEQAEQLIASQLSLFNADTPKWLSLLIRQATLVYLQRETEKALALLDTLGTAKVIERYAGHEEMNDGLELYWKIKAFSQQPEEAVNLLIEAEQFFYQNKNEEGLSALDRLIQRFPDKSIAAEAWLLKGDILSTMHKASGTEAYDTVWQQFPDSRLADQALVRSGKFYETEGKTALAKQRYEMILDLYPRSLLTEEIRDRLRELEGSP